MSTEYYWSEVFSSMEGSEFAGLKFSTDGELLISHTWSASSTIIVLEVNTGRVLSARRVSSGAYYNYNFDIKSLLISSDNPKMAYVLSNINTISS
jgi:hypothetical protein